MQVLTDQEIDMVSGGDSWAGTPAGRESVPMPPSDFVRCVNEESSWPGVSENSAMISCGVKKVLQMFSAD